MRNWEPQTLPGILEDGQSVPMRMPSETFTRVTETLSQLGNVDIPDWLDSGATNTELYAFAITLDTWEILINRLRGQLIKRAILE